MVFSKTYEQQIRAKSLYDFSGTKTIRKTISWIFLTFIKVVDVFRSSSSLNVKTQKSFPPSSQPTFSSMSTFASSDGVMAAAEPQVNFDTEWKKTDIDRFLMNDQSHSWDRRRSHQSNAAPAVSLSFSTWLTFVRWLTKEEEAEKSCLRSSQIKISRHSFPFFYIEVQQGGLLLLLLLLQLPLDFVRCEILLICL